MTTRRWTDKDFERAAAAEPERWLLVYSEQGELREAHDCDAGRVHVKIQVEGEKLWVWID